MPMPKALVAAITRKLAADEGLLHVASSLRAAARRGSNPPANPLVGQELGHLLGGSARGAIDDGAARLLRRQIGLQQPEWTWSSLAPACVGTTAKSRLVRLAPPSKQHQVDAEARSRKWSADVAHHVGLGGGGQAQHGRHGLHRPRIP